MAKTQFTDAAGRVAFKDENGRVWTEGGNRDTFYNVDEWNKRQLDKYGSPSGSSIDTGGSSANSISPVEKGKPSIDLNSIYEKSLNDPELQSLQSEYNSKKNALNEAINKINFNPFYSEASRVGRISKLQDKANAELNALQSQIAQKKADAQVRLNIATQQYNIDSQEYQNNLARLNSLISNGALAGASADDLANIAVQTGISTDMLKSIQDKANTKEIKPQVITDNNGNVTIIDTNTGRVINKISGIGKATVSTADNKEEAQFYKDIASGLDRLKSGDNWGAVWNSIKIRYPEINNAVIDQLLDKSTWGQAGAWQSYQTEQNAMKKPSAYGYPVFMNTDGTVK